MENGNEVTSSSLSSYLSNGSMTYHNPSGPQDPESWADLDHLSLSKLRTSLEKLLVDPDYEYSDAEIVVEGATIGVHRCVLAARSQNFHHHFKKGGSGDSRDGKPRYLMSDLVPNGHVGYEVFNVFLTYIYTGKLRPSPTEVSTCVDKSCVHDACRPAIDYAVELMYASATFQIKELVMLLQRRLLYFVERASAEDVIPILVVAFNFQQHELLSHCIERIARSDIENVVLEKELPDEVLAKLKLLRSGPYEGDQSMITEVDPVQEKRIKQIHKALDCDDVELVVRLISEYNITIDDAYALHYAAAYCNPKVFKELLGLGSANLNLKDSRGYTVLHVAARRKEPSILVALLSKGACATLSTADGQTAVSICRRMTRPKDYNQEKKQGQESNKDRICIDVLEREMWMISGAAYMSVLSDTTADDLMRLDYLECRVALAGMLFPAEAKLAMEIADAEWTPLYNGLTSKHLKGSLKGVDLNEAPAVRAKKLQLKLKALFKTVEMGRRYFPHCSEVLDNFLDDAPDDGFFLERGTEEEKKAKKMRFMELKEEVQKAFSKDIAKRSHLLPSSSSSSSPKQRIDKRAEKK